MIVAGLSERLLSAAELVRRGAVLADVGTDHAYLPLFLLKEGVISRAVCSDVNCGPLESAKANARDMGLYGKIDFILSDGAEALSGLGVSDVAICGMGGELIADIISRADNLRDGELNLILQPMTRVAHLRSFLWKEGFFVVKERYTREGDRAYVVMQARYDGTPRSISYAESELGSLLHGAKTPPERYYLEKRRDSLQRIAKGKLKGGEREPREASLIALIEELLK